MTSEVKQASPQVLMPKAGVEGKAARNRAPQADFAETLGIGKVARQQKPGEAKADLQEAEARPSWQRLTAKLDTAIDRTQDFGRTPEIGRKLAVAPPESDTEKKPAVERSADDTETAAKEMPETVAVKHTPDAAPAFMPNSQISVVSAKPVEAKIPEVHAAADDNLEIVAMKDALADDRPATPRSSAESSAAIGRDRSAAPSSSVEGIVAKDRDRSAAPALPTAKPNLVTPAAAEPAAQPSLVVAAAEPKAAAGAAEEKDAVSEAAGDTAKPVPRVTVLAQHNIPAPMPSTAIVLVDSIAASDLLEPARTVLPLDAIHVAAAPASAQSLKIQLHPAELGMVTATLRFAGEQLSIELQVETHEAHRRLTGDSETIVKSLRDLGYDIDRVTVLQPSIASSSGARSDGNAGMPSPQGRSPDQFGAGTANSGGGERGGRSSGDGGNAGESGHRNSSPRAEPQGSGLYI